MRNLTPFLVLPFLSMSVFAHSVNPLCTGVKGPEFTVGDGSVANPYLICTKKQFRRLSEEPDLLNKSFKLGDDLKFDNKPLKPIGTPSLPYTGVFDGDNYKLVDLYIEYAIPRVNNMGLFAYIKNGEVKNLKIKNVTFPPVQGIPRSGALAGSIENTKLTNIKIKGIDIPGPDGSGGMVGFVTGSTITKCSVQGIVRQNYGTDVGGGFLGEVQNSTVDQCFSEVKVVNSDSDVFGVSWVSAFIGYAIDSTITNVYAWGDLDYSNQDHSRKPHVVGGLFGLLNHSTVNFAYYVGKIIVDGDDVGAMAGVVLNPVPLQNTLFWDTTVCNVQTSPIGEGLSTSLLQQASLWQSRSFDPTIWKIVDGKYPTLRQV